ncbi:hypothetical protein JCM11251_003643 [Rhodosporidiobolus azoricus]
MDCTHPPVRVAIVGTGLAGLATAYLLSQAKHTHSDGAKVMYEVHLLERNERLGMDAASVSVPLEGEGEKGKAVRVDVPMRSINGGSHSRVKKLYDRLGVPLIASDFGYSFSRLSYAPPSSSSPSTIAPAPTSRPPSTDSVPSTPPPSYTSAPSSRPSTPPSSSSSITKPSSPSFARPTQKTHLLYSGSSGLAWPPLPFPSHTHSSLRAKAHHLSAAFALTLGYLYLLVLSFFYVSLGLSRPAPPSPPLGARLSPWTTPKRRFVQHFSVAAEPLDRFLVRHGLGAGPGGREDRGGLQELVRVLMAAVATVGVEEAGAMPVGELLEYINSTFLSPHYRTSPSFGVRGIVRALVAPIPPERIHLGRTITRIEALEGEGGEGPYAVVSERREGEKHEEQRLVVDHVVFATQAHQAASLLSTLSSLSSSLTASVSVDKDLTRTVSALRTFTYTRTLVVTHRDESILPTHEGDRRDLNLAVFEHQAVGSFVGAKHEKREKQGKNGSVEDEGEDEGDTLPPTSVQTTHIISPSSSPSPSPSSSSSSPTPPQPLILQTTNPLLPIPPHLTYSKTWFARAVVNPQSQASVALFSPPSSSLESVSELESSSLQGLPLGHTGEGKAGGGRGRGGIWFTGSYLAPGIPLLEGCVESAEGVVDALRGRVA